MKKPIVTALLVLTVGFGVSGCVVLDRHGHVDPGATVVANGLLIGAGVIGLGIAAHEAHHRHHARPYHVKETVVVRCGDCGSHDHERCRVRRWRR